MRHAILLYSTLTAAFGLAVESRAQFVIYSQPNDSPNGPYSDGVPGQFWSTRIADDFVLSDPVNRRVTEVTWWGSPEGMSHFELTNWTDWVVRFYEDDGGLPGAELYNETVPLEQTDPIWTGNYNMDGGKEYMQTVELATPPTFYIEQTYWISVGAVAIEPYDDGWRWSLNYFEGNNAMAADYFDGNGYTHRDGDVAFVLVGGPAGGCPRPGCEPGDLDGDCRVGLSDLGILLSHYGESGVGPDEGDFNNDGVVDLSDLGTLLAVYGNDCT
jgi:hypothetical protein